MLFYPIDPNCKYDQKTLKHLLSSGFSEDNLRIANKNPDYISTENFYYHRQKSFSQDFYSFQDFLQYVNQFETLIPVNFAFALKSKTSDCIRCNGSGYSPVAHLFQKTYYKHSQPYNSKGFESTIDKDGNLVVSHYGWGSEKQFTVEDFHILKEKDRVDEHVETFEEFMAWTESPLALSSSEVHYLSQGRAAKYEDIKHCPDCDGEGSHYLQKENDDVFLHIWMTDTSTGDCGAFDIESISPDELDQAIQYLKKANAKSVSMFEELLEKGMDVSKETFYWKGERHEDCHYQFDTMDEYLDEWSDVPDCYNEFAHYYIDEEEHLHLWVIHPRKGFSQFIEVKSFNPKAENFVEFITNIIKRQKLLFCNLDK